ncbi:hypothetical protein Dimus_035759 [Dionaea muscipula]
MCRVPSDLNLDVCWLAWFCRLHSYIACLHCQAGGMIGSFKCVEVGSMAHWFSFSQSNLKFKLLDLFSQHNKAYSFLCPL